MKLKQSVVGLGVFVLVLTGCGKNMSGTYSGTDSVSQNQTAANGANPQQQQYGGNQYAQQAQSYQFSLQLTQASGDTVNGTWSDNSGSGTLQGVISGDSISNIVMLKNPATTTTGTSNNSYGGGYGINDQGCTYTGSLSIGNGNNSLGGSLSATCGNSNYGYGGASSGYTRTFTLLKSGS